MLTAQQEFVLQRIVDRHTVCHNVAIASQEVLHQFGFGTHHIHTNGTPDTASVSIGQFEERTISLTIEFEVALRTIEGENDELTICLDTIKVDTLRRIGSTKHTQFARFLLLATYKE